MKILPVIAASIAFAAPTGSMAIQSERGPIVSLSTRSCNFSQATEVSLTRLIRDYSHLRGGCVEVRGWNRGRSIYLSRDDALADATPATTNRPLGVGIYGSDATLASLSAEPREVTAAGLVGACEVLNQGEVASGYCHSVIAGGFLILGEIQPRP